MCDCYDQDDIGFETLPPPQRAALRERTRSIEAAMEGDRVPDSAWAIFFGQAGGAIEWRLFERMSVAMQRASTYLMVQPFARQHAGRVKVLNCEEA